MKKEHIKFIKNTPAPRPNTASFLAGGALEIIKCKFENHKKNEYEYYGTMKCNLHCGCNCGLTNLFAFLQKTRGAGKKHLLSLGKLISATPLITRETFVYIDRKAIPVIYVYGELNPQDELDYYNEINTHNKKQRRHILLEYASKINAPF